MPKKHKQKYTCDYCGKSCPVKNTLVHHIFKYHAHKLKRRKLLPCPYCKYYFASNITQRKAHILQFHNIPKTIDSKNCWRAEHDSARKQKNGSSFICDYCYLKCNYKSRLISHIRNIHIKSDNSDSVYSCDMCQSYFKSRGWLGRHIMKCHINIDKEVPDDHSKELNDVMYNLKILNAQNDNLTGAIGASQLDFGNVNIEMKSTLPHFDVLVQAIGATKLDFVPNVDFRKLEVHKENGSAVLKCSICKFKTTRISFLNRHMISHSTAKQYQCPHCPRKCGYLYNLKQHIRFRHNNNNVDTKKERRKKNPINNGKSLKDVSLPILFENSILSIDDSILNDMLKDIPSDMELPTSLIDIDNVLENSELVTPVVESPIVDKDSGNRKEPVNKISKHSDYNASFKTPLVHRTMTTVNALRDHDYSYKWIIEASESNNCEINNSNIVMNTCNINEATDTSHNADAISDKLLEIPDSSNIIIEDLLDLAEIVIPDPLANIVNFNTDDDKLMNSSFGGNDHNQSISKHTSNIGNKLTQKVVILKNELLLGSRKYVPPNTFNMIDKTTQKVVTLKDKIICGSRPSVQPIHNVVNDYIIYGKDNKQNFVNNASAIFPNAIFTPSMDTASNNFTSFEVVSEGIATDLNHTNQTKQKISQNLEEICYEFSNLSLTNATNAPIIADTGPAIGASNALEDENIIVNTLNDNNIHEAYESTYGLERSSAAPAPVETVNMITNNVTCPKDIPTIDQCVNFDLDLILSSASNTQVTDEQMQSIFGNTPKSNDNANLSLGKCNTPPLQSVLDELLKEGTSDYIYDADEIIGALGESEQAAGTEVSVPLSDILACDPTHEDNEEATRNAIANEVMLSDGNTEELVLKLLSQDTIKTLTNAKYGVFCEICNRTFRRERNLREHIQVVHNKQKHTCDICGKTLYSYKSMKVHIQSHSEKVQCQVCGLFLMATSLSIHMRSHNNNKPYLCALCGLRFATFSKKKCHILKSHLKSGTSSTKSTLMDIINEMDESSSDDVAVPPVIIECVNAILEKKRQYKPVDRKRVNKIKEYECQHCKKVFNYFFNYNRHLQTHNGEDINSKIASRCRR